MFKKEYDELELEILNFECEDVITTSCPVQEPDELPPILTSKGEA